MSRPDVFLHIGAPKTGTTYIQRKLFANRKRLRSDGFLCPGKSAGAHVYATFDLRGAKHHGNRHPNVRGAWQRTVDEIRESGFPAVIDSELLSGASSAQIARAVKDLSFADVHVVYTLRDMARTLPAAWQERVKNCQKETLAEFLDIVHLPDDQRKETGNRFWHLQDTPAILARWAEHVPADRIHVVTLPPNGSDPSVLWTRFAGVLGLDPTRYREPGRGANTSLGAPEAAVLRRLNVALDAPEFPWSVYAPVVKNHLAVQLASRRGPSIGLSHEEHDWCVKRSQEVADFISTAGYEVVGDLAETIPGEWREGADPDAVDGDAQADAAVTAMAALVRYVADHGEKNARTRRLESDLQRAQAELRARAEEPPRQRIKRTVVELSAQVGWVNSALRAYRKARRRG
ncbi:MAG TPA: hypothetical protein VFH38_05410 [Jatrophihabitans sp.]|nr:hypothetical protein [Jatrophihabitans sp.]